MEHTQIPEQDAPALKLYSCWSVVDWESEVGYDGIVVDWEFREREKPLLSYPELILGYESLDPREQYEWRHFVDSLFTQAEAKQLAKYLAIRGDTLVMDECQTPIDPRDEKQVGPGYRELDGCYSINKDPKCDLAFCVVGYFYHYTSIGAARYHRFAELCKWLNSRDSRELMPQIEALCTAAGWVPPTELGPFLDGRLRALLGYPIR